MPRIGVVEVPMPWPTFWTITWQVVLFALITMIPLALWFLLVRSAWAEGHRPAKYTYRG